MGALEKANPQIVDSIKQLSQTITDPKVAKAQAGGAAFQSVSLSTSIAIQDATDYVRNVSTMATTAIGVALAQLVATKDVQYAKIIDTAQEAISKAAQNYSAIGKAAVEIAKSYPVGE